MVFPEGLEIISRGCFSYSGIEEVTFPSSIKTIEDEAFLGCTELQNINLPESLEKVGEFCFA